MTNKRDMGGAGYIFTGENDADIMHNSAKISQTRSFLYIDECSEGKIRQTRSDFEGSVNVGSDEMVLTNQLVDLVSDIAGKTIHKHHIDGPLGERGRNSDNRLIKQKLGWKPSATLRQGLESTYGWIAGQSRRNAV